MRDNICLVCQHVYEKGNVDLCKCERPVLASLSLILDKHMSIYQVRLLPQYKTEMQRRNIIPPDEVKRQKEK